MSIERLPICPICNKPVRCPSMHEVIITRGEAEKLPLDIRAQIYVEQNCVLLHEGACHQKAQWTKEGFRMCLDQLLKYCTDIPDWIDRMNAMSDNIFAEKRMHL